MVVSYKLEDISKFAKIATRFAHIGNDYIVGRFDTDLGISGLLSTPMRVAGLTIATIREGEVQGEIDMQPFTLRPGCLMVVGGNSVVNLLKAPKSHVAVDALFCTYRFIQDLNFDLAVIDMHDLVEKRPEHVVQIEPAEREMLEHLFDMLYLNASLNTEATFAKNIGRSLMQALIYQLLQMRANRQGRPEPMVSESGQQQSRQMAYVQEFMRLLQLHHSRQRSIAFYASRLCISPKYLSHLIKDATGRSASDWIAECVVQEAKNMLRYSNKNIQQVAYDLNFSTQSSFGKYFKHATGISPSEYQKK